MRTDDNSAFSLLFFLLSTRLYKISNQYKTKMNQFKFNRFQDESSHPNPTKLFSPNQVKIDFAKGTSGKDNLKTTEETKFPTSPQGIKEHFERTVFELLLASTFILGLICLLYHRGEAKNHPLAYFYVLYSTFKFLICMMISMLLFGIAAGFLYLIRKKDVVMSIVGAIPAIILVLYIIGMIVGFPISIFLLFVGYGEAEADIPFLLKFCIGLDLLGNILMVGYYVRHMFCGKMRKSSLLEEIEGEQYNINQDLIKNIEDELQRARIHIQHPNQNLHISPPKQVPLKKDRPSTYVTASPAKRERSTSSHSKQSLSLFPDKTSPSKINTHLTVARPSQAQLSRYSASSKKNELIEEVIEMPETTNNKSDE